MTNNVTSIRKAIKQKRLHVVVDMDDTLCDFMPTLVRKANAFYGSSHDYKSINCYNHYAWPDEVSDYFIKHALNYDFYRDLPERSDGDIDALKRLYEAHDVTIATATPLCASTGMINKAKRRWLAERLDMPSFDYEKLHFIATQNKSAIHADILVDDNVDNVVDFISNNYARAVLIDTPANTIDSPEYTYAACRFESQGLLVRKKTFAEAVDLILEGGEICQTLR